MLIVLKHTATKEQADAVCAVIEKLGYEAYPMPGAQTTAICITGNKGSVPPQHFTNMEGVLEVIEVSKPYKLASLETKPDPTIVTIGNERIGEGLTIMAGPCSVEAEESSFRIAESLKQLGINFFRAGAYKPRTGPYSFQGLGIEGLEILQKIKDKFDMKIVTEVMDTETLPAINEVADVLQVGTRNMSNFTLLKALSKVRTPVLLKRGMSATLDEFLLAAEYILVGGNYNVILCERGIRTFSNHCRNTLDVAAVPALQAMTHLPIIIDPSHAAGLTYMVFALARAGIAAGAHGVIIEAHDDAANAYSDGQQALHPDELQKLIGEMQGIYELIS